jgi:hypothetical protein
MTTPAIGAESFFAFQPLGAILGSIRSRYPDPSITMTSDGSVGGEESVRAHG